MRRLLSVFANPWFFIVLQLLGSAAALLISQLPPPPEPLEWIYAVTR